ncbi:hypothetical protein [Herbidospora cretacea]|uniref:hypothetical protein n=1 Tax=Herbidospora cretacea TaxID=28444 RepID=UPI001C3F3EAC|nr:hypothetical protein [Herbidospora cretacea]
MSAERPVTPTATPPARELGDRPAISHPDALSPAALADAVAGQPRRGLIGLLFVVPLAVLLAIGANGAVHSLLVLGPIITFALPVLAMIAFWWEDWPGVMFLRQWSGLYDTVIVVAGGVVLTVARQFVVNGPELVGVFAPGPAHIGTYPATVHLCGCIFTIMLQLTLVCERRPLDRFGRIPSGLVALALSWALGLAAWLVVVRSLGVPGAEYAAFFVSIGLWQMIFYTAVRGWPFARIARRGTRLLGGQRDRDRLRMGRLLARLRPPRLAGGPHHRRGGHRHQLRPGGGPAVRMVAGHPGDPEPRREPDDLPVHRRDSGRAPGVVAAAAGPRARGAARARVGVAQPRHPERPEHSGAPARRGVAAMAGPCRYLTRP